jgi:hypothetical protein
MNRGAVGYSGRGRPRKQMTGRTKRGYGMDGYPKIPQTSNTLAFVSDLSHTSYTTVDFFDLSSNILRVGISGDENEQ